MGLYSIRSGLFWAAVMIVCAGCTAIDAAKPQTSAQYFGWVEVKAPAVAAGSASPITVLDTRAIGLRLGRDVGMGYFHDQHYRIPPDCRLVILVQNKDQLDFVSKEIGKFKEGICAATKAS